jgi:hypothetical protein
MTNPSLCAKTAGRCFLRAPSPDGKAENNCFPRSSPATH